MSKGLFAVSPLKVDAGARGLAHLDYNDLHITGQLREEDPGEHSSQKALLNLQSDVSLKEPSPVLIPPPATSKEETLSPEHNVGKTKILADDAALNMEEEEQEESLTLLKSEFPPSTVARQVPLLSTAASPLSGTVEPIMDDDDDLAAAVKKKHGKRLNRR